MKSFFDSSAFAKRYLAEQGSEKIDEICAQTSQLGISIICIPEVVSALARLRRENKLTSSQFKQCKNALLADASDAHVCLLTPAVIENSMHLLEHCKLRAMDALHLACALEWQPDLFISSDKEQLIAAKQFGLKIQIL